jgi:transcriptional regulator with XRE-family HTH domain
MNMKKIGTEVRRRREKMGLSQYELAQKCGVARLTLRELEGCNLTGGMHTKTLSKILNAFGLDLGIVPK